MSADENRPRRTVPFAEQLRTDPSAVLDVWAGRDPVTGEWPEQIPDEPELLGVLTVNLAELPGLLVTA